MKVYYTRVSTTEQNVDRQMNNLSKFDYVLTDYCSGSINLWDRPKGKQIKKLIEEKKLTHLEVHSIDRLGRNTVAVLEIWKELTELGIKLICRNPNFQNINDNGQTDIFSELMISIISTMADFERKMILERQREGIEKRRLAGKYSGRQIGTKETSLKFLSKPKTKMIIKDLQNGYKTNEIVDRCRCSFSTIQKIKNLIEEKTK